MFSIDGIEWAFPCEIQRVAEVKASSISGIMLDKSYFNDVLGTYMSYTVRIAIPFDSRQQYYAIYEKITEPVDGHTFVFPYNSETVTVTGRVTNISDQYVRMPNNGKYWKGTTFTVIANNPTKTISLTESITRGMSPLPNPVSAADGDAYQYNATTGEWEEIEGLPDADVMYF